MTYLVGVDIGGTFTDVVLLDRQTGRYVVQKLLTTTDDPSQAVADGVAAVLTAGGVPVDDLDYVVHGTTLVANTIIQREGARTALLVTAGFEDLLEMRREQRYDPYDLFATFPDPLVPGELRIPVTERLLADGSVHQPLDEADLRARLRELRAAGVESVAICLLHSFVDPRHEELAREIVKAELPDVTVSLSSEIVPQSGEYERMSTTAANAYVQPVMSRYLGRLQDRLTEMGARGELYLMLSDGGITSVESARTFPVRLLESGPAAGIIAACKLGEQTGDDQLVAFDMGGTTAKFCLVDGGKPLTTWDMEAARVNRFRRGSGLPLRIPSVEMVEIGLGGGSIARRDELGLLKVGPQSAESEPGPACYGLGGERATVTDALVVLGYLDPEFFLGGRMSLAVDAARAAITTDIAEPLGMPVPAAALGIYQITCQQMAESVRMQFAERGKDARSYAVVATGGAGPAHACEVARALKVPKVVIPPAAGIMSAAGLLMAPFAFSLQQSFAATLAEADPAEVTAVLEKLTAQGRQIMADAGVSPDRAEVTWSLDLKYAGQKRTVEVPLRERRFEPAGLPGVVEDFEAIYAVYHGRPNRALDTVIQSLTARVTGPAGAGWLGERASAPAAKTTRSRPAWFVGHPEAIDCPVYQRGDLTPGERRSGPAIIEDAESTAVIGPRDAFHLDEDRNIIVAINAGERTDA